MSERPGRALTDAGALALALAAAAGAWWSRPLALVPCVGTVLIALLMRRSGLLIVGVFVLASAFGARSWSGVDPPMPERYSGTATVVSDPTRRGPVVHAVLEVRHRRLDVWAAGSPGRRLELRSAGEALWVEGTIRASSAGRARSLAVRHIAGVFELERVVDWGTGNRLTRSTNRVRALLLHGARVLEPVDRSLYLGLVIGDDRHQPTSLVDDFRASGLGHLSAVSGQNVVFLLAVAAPALRRCRPALRWMLTMALLAWFAALTRFEPSVLRATVMAGIAATAFALGRRASSVRLLALTVTALLLVDPLLVHSVGFWMSVSATLGIVLWSPALAGAVPGPRWLVLPMAVSLSAQAGVASVVWWVFDREALWALPANVLAEPCAALVMTLGLPAGLVAGLVPDGLAVLLHAPTWVAVRGLRGIASVGASVDVAWLQPVGSLAGMGVVGWSLWRSRVGSPRDGASAPG